MADVPLIVISDNTSSERRVTPSWTIRQLRTKLEPITGIPPSSQRLLLQAPSREKIAVESHDEEATRLTSFPLAPYAELHVIDTRPAAAKLNLSDTSGVEKYTMPEEEYAKKTDSVLAWKKAAKLGRFDPGAPGHEQAKVAALAHEVESRGIAVGKRCRVGGDDARRGEVRYVGEVGEIPGGIGAWVGIQLDEPVGKNDGSVGGTRYWGEASEAKRGVFVRPERVEVGDFPELNDLQDMEEI
ncbi:hypothetical protein P8C59_004331 [Phyllachora maydis]|uniref:CAP-Gly domain-containing protein n=1 Tax=Phyllachora maydis TaxID=1825666 RepID=A0AAD9MB72_9PEZI|nr:hypothetical protein P8C59_004331 [Phyllachora maydis]